MRFRFTIIGKVIENGNADAFKRSTKGHAWLREIAARKPYRVAATAFANKTARVIWAMMISGENYRQPVPAAA